MVKHEATCAGAARRSASSDSRLVDRGDLAPPLSLSSRLATASPLLPRVAGWSAATLCYGPLLLLAALIAARESVAIGGGPDTAPAP
jgi:hypothetical protein